METIKKVATSVADAAMGKPDLSNTRTTLTGCPIAHLKNSMTAGPNGPVMMQDNILLEKLSQFDREKIPARNVHALGYGVHGHFTVTNDITKYTRADVFSKVGKKTDLFARLS